MSDLLAGEGFCAHSDCLTKVDGARQLCDEHAEDVPMSIFKQAPRFVRCTKCGWWAEVGALLFPTAVCDGHEWAAIAVLNNDCVEVDAVVNAIDASLQFAPTACREVMLRARKLLAG